MSASAVEVNGNVPPVEFHMREVRFNFFKKKIISKNIVANFKLKKII